MIKLEQAILGCCLLDSRAIKEAKKLINKGLFDIPAHQIIFIGMCELDNEEIKIDIYTLLSWLKREDLNDFIDEEYLLHLANNTPSAGNIISYIKELKKHGSYGYQYQGWKMEQEEKHNETALKEINKLKETINASLKG